MDKKILFDINQIMAILPHRPPFLFVDYVTSMVAQVKIETERYIRADEPFFAGHFPSKPIMPGVLVTDALAQTSGLLWGFSKKQATPADQQEEDTEPEIFFLAAVNIKYVNPAYPGDTLCMIAHADSNFGQFYTYNVEAMVKRNMIAKGKLTLAMMKGKA